MTKVHVTNKRYTDEQRMDCLRLRANGCNGPDIAEITGVLEKSVWAICKRANVKPIIEQNVTRRARHSEARRHKGNTKKSLYGEEDAVCRLFSPWMTRAWL